MDMPLSLLFGFFCIIIGTTASDRSSRSSMSEVGDDEELVEASGERERTTEFGTDPSPTENLILDGYRDYADPSPKDGYMDYADMGEKYHATSYYASPRLLVIVCVSVLLSAYLLIMFIVLLCNAKKIKTSPEPLPEN